MAGTGAHRSAPVHADSGSCTRILTNIRLIGLPTPPRLIGIPSGNLFARTGISRGLARAATKLARAVQQPARKAEPTI
jgi:hypothetical protein